MNALARFFTWLREQVTYEECHGTGADAAESMRKERFGMSLRAITEAYDRDRDDEREAAKRRDA